MTITLEQQDSIRNFLRGRNISSGIGTEEEACSIASINLALTSMLTSDIPPCMSEVIGSWIIRVQDAMPDEMRNSDEWRELLPLAAGTGRDKEQERHEIIMDWMWAIVLPTVQPIADKHGFGDKWKAMCEQRTADAADLAARAARAAYAAYADLAARAARAADAAARAALAAGAAFWTRVNPPALLRRLIEVC